MMMMMEGNQSQSSFKSKPAFASERESGQMVLSVFYDSIIHVSERESVVIISVHINFHSRQKREAGRGGD